MTKQETDKAFKEGYETFQKRRGLNPYPYSVNDDLWQAFEAGWCQAYKDNAPDRSREALEERAERTGEPIFLRTIEETALAAAQTKEKA